MALLALVQLALIQKLRHAEQRVQRRADFMADIGDESGFGARAFLRHVARRFRRVALAGEADDKIGIGAPQCDAFIKQGRDAVAITVKHAAEEQQQQRGKAGIGIAFKRQQPDQRQQRENGMRRIGRAIGRTRDELRGRHAHEGERQESLCREIAGNEPDESAQPPRHARCAGIPDITFGPIHRIVGWIARFVAFGELACGDGGGDLQQERNERNPRRNVVAIKRRRDAQSRKRQEEIQPAHAEEYVDTLGGHGARVRTAIRRSMTQVLRRGGH